MKTLKFANFWKKDQDIDVNFSQDFHLSKYIIEQFDFELDQKTYSPDILLFSCYGDLDKVTRYKSSFKIFYSAENLHERYPFNQYVKYRNFSDISFTFDPHTETNFYFPNFYRKLNYKVTSNKLDPRSIDSIMKKKTEFCCFLHSNNSSGRATKVRNKFMLELCKYKKVNSGGLVLNNLGFRVPKEQSDDFIKRHKFIIAFENSSYPGYTTEKISNGFNNFTVPTYFGDPLVENLFNVSTFVNCNGKTIRDSIREVIHLDTNDVNYKQYLQPRKVVHSETTLHWQLFLKYHLEHKFY